MGSSQTSLAKKTSDDGCETPIFKCPPTLCTMNEPPICKDGQQPEVTGTSDDGCDIPIFKCPATPKCPRRQEWKQHGTSCQDACKDLESGPPICTMQTVSGCFCEQGKNYVKNKKGKCVPKSQKACRKEACAKGEIFMKCGSSCEPTCENPKPPSCNKMCKLNTCQCRSGKVRRARDGKCVSQKKC